MAFYKNKAGQKVILFAYDSDGVGVAGLGNIGVTIYKDGATNSEATNSVVEIEGGYYYIELTANETNANVLLLTSSTGVTGNYVSPVIIYTQPEVVTAVVSSLSGYPSYASNYTITAVTSGAITTTNYPTPSTAQKQNALFSHDEDFLIFSETNTGTAGLTLTINSGPSTVSEIPVMLHISGYYAGSPSHQVAVQIYNYRTSSWDSAGTMLNRSSAFDYSFPLTTDNHDYADNGDMEVRFVHNTTTYINSHKLYLDYVRWEKATTVSNESEIAAIKAQTDQLTFTNANGTSRVLASTETARSRPANR